MNLNWKSASKRPKRGVFVLNKALLVTQFMIDVDIHNLKALDLKDLPQDTGWGTVPTPVF
jgi:hypothetical protein